jgi:hypothetical protein
VREKLPAQPASWRSEGGRGEQVARSLAGVQRGGWRNEIRQGARVARRSAGERPRTGELQVCAGEAMAILGFRGRGWAP